MQKDIDTTEIENRVKKILSNNLNLSFNKINLDSSLINDLSMDSFAAIEIMFAMDAEFGIKVTQDEVFKFNTVKDIVKKIKELIDIERLCNISKKLKLKGN